MNEAVFGADEGGAVCDGSGDDVFFAGCGAERVQCGASASTDLSAGDQGVAVPGYGGGRAGGRELAAGGAGGWGV